MGGGFSPGKIAEDLADDLRMLAGIHSDGMAMEMFDTNQCETKFGSVVRHLI